MDFGAIPQGYGDTYGDFGIWGDFGSEYGEYGGEYGASEKKCGKIQSRIEKQQAKYDSASRSGQRKRLLRRINRNKSRYVKKGCSDQTGASILSSEADNFAAQASAQAMAAQEAATEFDVMSVTNAAASSSGGTNQMTWIVGGAAVLGLLGVVAYTMKKDPQEPRANRSRRNRSRR
jgi:hypothetical protein